jgi:VCBS repeat-containing protein
MRWLTKWFGKTRLSMVSRRRPAKPRFRKSFLEQFEDRRVLAVAVDDEYTLVANQTNTITTGGYWSNDSYNPSWTDSYWEEQLTWHDGYWEDPAWYEGYYDENNEWHEGYWSPSEPVWHDGYWEGGWVVNTYYASDSILSGPSHGTLTPLGEGSFEYTPATNYFGNDSFTYELTDDNGSSTATVTIILNGAPAANDDEYQTNVNTPLTVSAPGVLSNDSDPDDDVLTVTAHGDPSHGAVTVDADGSFVYTPDQGYRGLDSFTYTVSDGLLTTDATVTIMVNGAPIANDDNYSVNEGATLTVSAALGVLANDSDPNNDALTAVLADDADHGDLTLNANGSFVYTPDANFAGTDTFSYFADDGLSTTLAVVTIVVNSINDAPAGTNGIITMLEDTVHTFAASDFGFTDPLDSPPNSLLSVTITSVPVLGTFTYNGSAVFTGQVIPASGIASGLLRFTPAPNAGYYAPYASFAFKVQDNGGTANGGIDLDPSANSIQINLTGVNDEPAGTDGAVTTPEETTYTIGYNDFGFTDWLDYPNTQFHSVKITTLPATGSLTLNGAPVSAGQFVLADDLTFGNLRYTPPVNATGAPHTSFTFQVKDTYGTENGGVDLDASPNTLSINVTPVNDAPAGTNNTITKLEDNSIHTFTAADFGLTDPLDSPANGLHSVKITTLPAAGFLRYANNPVTAGQFISLAGINVGLLKFSRVSNDTTATSFTFQVKDDGGTADGGVDLDASPNTMTMNVTSVNDYPFIVNKEIKAGLAVDYTFTLADFEFNDARDNPANNFVSVKITEIPTSVTVKYNGSAITQSQVDSGYFVSAADIASGLLSFTRQNGTPGGSNLLKVQATDDGGTANGGADIQPFDSALTLHSPRFNVAKPIDVNNDGTESAPDDALDVINYLNAFGQGPIDPNAPTDPFDFWDTNNDYKVTDADAIRAIQKASGVSNSWYNLLNNISSNNLDVNADRQLNLTDVVDIRNYLNANGEGPRGPGLGYLGLYFFDVNTDGQVDNEDLALVEDYFAPQGTDNTIDVGSAITYTFSTSDFAFTDYDSPPDALQNVVITTLPDLGQLLYDGSAVTQGQSIPASDIAAGDLVYSRAGDIEPGDASFLFQVQDNGGTANGSVDLDLTPATMTLALVSPWHNTVDPFDVTDDGDTSPADALAVINWINAFGVGPIPSNASEGPDFYDVDNDYQVTRRDEIFAIIGAEDFANVWHNPLVGEALDVNADGTVDSDDEDLVLDFLTANGATQVPTGQAAEDTLLAMLSDPRFYDVNDDGWVDQDDADAF